MYPSNLLRRRFFLIALNLIILLDGAASLSAQDSSRSVANERQADVVVFGGTPAGIMAAVAAGRSGQSVILLEPSYLLGGMMSGGLQKTDIGKRETIGGLSREFFARVLNYYVEKYGVDSPQVKALDYNQKPNERSGYYFEPKVALQIFRQMLEEAGVSVQTKERLESVEVVPGKIVSITTRHYETGIETRTGGHYFIDGSYEGDLMAGAGVLYRVGREARSEYHEPLAGLTEGPLEYRGTGDHRVQSYNIRSTISVDPNNFVPVPQPQHYFREAHAHLIDVVNQHHLTQLDQLYPDRYRWGEINGKMDPNKADFLGVNFGYSEGDYEQRARITAKVQDYWLSLWYMLQNDPDLPEAFKADARRYGLPRDEYGESNHVSPQIYVRVARRMLGRYFLTQHDVRYQRHKPDAICLGSYGTDCHAIQLIQSEHGIEQEGDFNGAADPYEIPYRCLTPHGVGNLLVVAAISASHVAYSSVRMEPVFMMLGQAAGMAVHLAHEHNSSVQDISIERLQSLLRDTSIPLQAPYRPWVEVRVVTPGPYLPGAKLDFIVVEKDVRAPLTRYAWSFDGSGAAQAEGPHASFAFPSAGQQSIMLLAWQDDDLFAVPAVLDIDVGAEPSLNREVHYLDAKTTGRWIRARGPQIEYRDRVGLLDEGKGDGQASAEFTTVLAASGRYCVSVAYATAGNRATHVQLSVEHAEGTSSVTVNQRSKESPFAFTPLGEFHFKADTPASVRFSNQDADGHVFIDSVRWIWMGE